MGTEAFQIDGTNWREKRNFSHFLVSACWLICSIAERMVQNVAKKQQVPRCLYLRGNSIGQRMVTLSKLKVRLSLIVALYSFGLSTTQAQIRDGFESGPPRISLWSSDASARVTLSELTSVSPYSGQSSETVEVNCAGGSFVYMVYPIRPAALIPELTCSAYMRAAPRGMRMGFRVILPQSVHPASGVPAHILIFGNSNEGRGKWSRLVVSNTKPEFESQLRVLNQAAGYIVDASNAYVDAIVFDVYSGPGATKFQIDDLAVDGLVDALGSPVESQMLSGTANGNSVEAVDVATQLVRMQRTVPRIAQYRDESVDWLKSLGFTALLSETEADPLLLQQARRAGMQIIAPPPAHIDSLGTENHQASITSWHLSSAAALDDLENTRQAAITSNQFPPHLTHPRFVEAMEAHSLYSRLAEIVAFPIPMPTTINSAQQSNRMVSEQLRQAGYRALPIASIVVEPPYAWLKQCDWFINQLESRGQMVPGTTDPASLVLLRQTLARTLALGFKGVFFRSTTALDSGQEKDLARARMMSSANAEIELFRPWIEGGLEPQPLSTIANSLFTGTSISTERSSLITLMTQGDFDQIAPMSPQRTALEFDIPRQNTGEQAYRVTHGALESIPLTPKPEGWGIRVSNPSIVEFIVITNDRVVLQYLQSALRAYSMQAASNRLEAAAELLTLAQSTLHQEGLALNDAWWVRLQEAEALLRSATSYQSQNNLSASMRDSDQSLNASLEILRSSWLRSQAAFNDPRSSPFLGNLSSLPLHWQLARMTAGRGWQRHLIPGGELTNLQQMTDLGWSHSRRMTDRVEHQFAVTQAVTPTETATLLASARSRHGDIIPGGFAGSTMRIRTPPMEAWAGRVIRWSGRIMIEQASDQPLAGILVCDSLGGSALGVPIAADASRTGQWQNFEIYRISGSGTPLQFYFDVRGAISAKIADLTLESMTITPTSNYVTVPATP